MMHTPLVHAAVSAIVALIASAGADAPRFDHDAVQSAPVAQPPAALEPGAPPDGRGDRPERGSRPGGATRQSGLILASDNACAGYTLFAPLNSTATVLVDLEGNVVHSWSSQFPPGQAAYLLDDGSLLRCATERRIPHFRAGGIGGRVERIAPDGTVVWTFIYADEKHCLHHDIEPLPNGHILMIAWEKKSREDVIAAGGDPEHFTGHELWPDTLIEVQPQEAGGGKIVWEWHVWDHLVQEFDPDRANYGVVAEHPELVDLNFRRVAPRESPEEIERLQALGYVAGGEPLEEKPDEGRGRRGGGGGRPGGGPERPDMWADWCHTNSVAYNPRLDQILLSVHTFNEIWVIDHSTTTEEAAGHRGGRSGKGGDLLYRWGNPRAYGAGTARDQRLFAQHDARWIPDGMPGAGRITVFNNGMGRPDGRYSSVIEIEPPVDASGHYRLSRGQAFGPAGLIWEYTAAEKDEFFSSHISGAERLPNGNTLICAGEQGRLFEVDASGTIVWDYVNPHAAGFGPGPAHGPPGDDAHLRRGPGRGPRGGRPRPPFEPPMVVAIIPWLSPWSAPIGPWGVDVRGLARGPFAPPGRFGGPGFGSPGFGGPGFGPPGPGGPEFGGPGFGGPPGGGGLFRAARLAPEHPGVRRLLEASRSN